MVIDVRIFDATRIAEYLDAKGVHYTRSDCGFVADYAPAEPYGPAIKLRLASQGHNGAVLVVQASSVDYFSMDDVPRLLGLINEWTLQHRWPRLAVSIGGPDGPSLATVVADNHFDLESGVHEDLLDDLIGSHLSASFSFFRFLHSAITTPAGTVPSAAELDAWLSD